MKVVRGRKPAPRASGFGTNHSQLLLQGPWSLWWSPLLGTESAGESARCCGGHSEPLLLELSQKVRESKKASAGSTQNPSCLPESDKQRTTGNKAESPILEPVITAAGCVDTVTAKGLCSVPTYSKLKSQSMYSDKGCIPTCDSFS